MLNVCDNAHKRTKIIAILWFVLLAFWPKPSDIPLDIDEETQKKQGEGLYKSKITNANFGLLGVNFYESNEGKRRWHINSKFAELHRKQNYAYLKEVIANFFAEKTGNIVVTKSDFGRSWTDKSLVELEGNVSIRSKSGYLFTMDRLNYNGKTHEFSTEDHVNMKGPIPESPTMLLEGKGLNADIDQEHFVLKSDVTGHKKLKKNEWLKIRSRSGEFFTDESRAVFLDDVKAQMPKAFIESDIFEISSGGENESLEARGRVTLKSRDRIAHSENAFIEIGGNTIILEGKARVEAKDAQVSGRRIVMYTDDDRIEVTQAEGKSHQ